MFDLPCIILYYLSGLRGRGKNELIRLATNAKEKPMKPTKPGTYLVTDNGEWYEVEVIRGRSGLIFHIGRGTVTEDDFERFQWREVK